MAEKTAVYNSVAEMVGNAMQDKGLSIRDLAETLDLTYEHARRIVRGEAVPSKFVLRPLCNHLGISYGKAEQLATGERIRKKYGVIADHLIPARIAGMEPIEKVWNQLTEAQKNDAITMVQAWARNNRKERVTKEI